MLEMWATILKSPVALLAEGVDRNTKDGEMLTGQYVALLAEGVDRNMPGRPAASRKQASPSSRRAWIEILRAGQRAPPATSPSSRRAWIEILMLLMASATIAVALLAEGVDRNHDAMTAMSIPP